MPPHSRPAVTPPDMYAQLEQRVQRDHGRSFDRLLSNARVEARTLGYMHATIDSRQPGG
jgi:hypothetical protein